jgi:starvation-inducible DNA-binding protein
MMPREAVATNLSGDAVAGISGALHPLLAGVFAHYLRTKNFHWRMRGRHFRDYRLLLDDRADAARRQRLNDNDQEAVTPRDMLTELCEDDRQLTRFLGSTHQVCDERNDVATAGSIENWINQLERRKWFLSEKVRDVYFRPTRQRRVFYGDYHN